MVPWAVLPTAGRGTRLLPATAVVPKVLLPVGTVPMLHWAVAEAIQGRCRRSGLGGLTRWGAGEGLPRRRAKGREHQR